MTWRRIAAVIVALGSIAGACAEVGSNYDVEIHISRVYGVNDDLPERLTR